MTIHDFLSQCIHEEQLLLFKKECIRQETYNLLYEENTYDNPADIISKLICWRTSEKGGFYWKELCHDLHRKYMDHNFNENI